MCSLNKKQCHHFARKNDYKNREKKNTVLNLSFIFLLEIRNILLNWGEIFKFEFLEEFVLVSSNQILKIEELNAKTCIK